MFMTSASCAQASPEGEEILGLGVGWVAALRGDALPKAPDDIGRKRGGLHVKNPSHFMSKATTALQENTAPHT